MSMEDVQCEAEPEDNRKRQHQEGNAVYNDTADHQHQGTKALEWLCKIPGL